MMVLLNNKNKMIGKKLDKVLIGIEESLWDFDVNVTEKPCYTQEGFRACVKIFMSAMLDKMWELQQKEGMSLDTSCQMAEKLGAELRSLVKTYTDIDTHKLYGDNEEPKEVKLEDLVKSDCGLKSISIEKNGLDIKYLDNYNQIDITKKT